MLSYSAQPPFAAWYLTPGFKPVEVSVVAKVIRYGVLTFESAEGRRFVPGKLFATLDAAIAEGHADLVRQQIRVDKMAANLQKKRANLDKARD